MIVLNKVVYFNNLQLLQATKLVRKLQVLKPISNINMLRQNMKKKNVKKHGIN